MKKFIVKRLDALACVYLRRRKVFVEVGPNETPGDWTAEVQYKVADSDQYGPRIIVYAGDFGVPKPLRVVA